MTTQEQKQERIVNVKNLRPEKIQKSLLLQAFLEKNMERGQASAGINVVTMIRFFVLMARTIK